VPVKDLKRKSFNLGEFQLTDIADTKSKKTVNHSKASF
jgi:hypothetical protein